MGRRGRGGGTGARQTLAHDREGDVVVHAHARIAVGPARAVPCIGFARSLPSFRCFIIGIDTKNVILTKWREAGCICLNKFDVAPEYTVHGPDGYDSP